MLYSATATIITMPFDNKLKLIVEAELNGHAAKKLRD